MDAPTCEQLNDEDGFDRVSRISDASWRHGTRETQVFRRVADGTYWETTFRLSADGETNELAEGLARIRQVHPQEKMVTVFV